MSIENMYSSTAEKARAQAEEVLASAQGRVEQASDWVADRKQPVRKVTDMGLKLSAISHRTTDKLLKQQANVVEGEVDAMADYLKSIAEADDLRGLVREQFSVFPRFTRRALDNTRQTFTILREAGSDVGGIVRTAVTDIRTAPAAKRAKSAVKKAAGKAGRTTKTTAKKASTKAKVAAEKATQAA